MWYEIKIKTDTQALEAIYPILYNANVSGIVTEDPNDPIYSAGYVGDWDYFEEDARQFEYDGALVKGYIECDDAQTLIDDLRKKILALSDYGFSVGPVEISYTEVHEEDWANEWKKHYKPFVITPGIVIKPLWEDYQSKPEEIVITMDPGKAFGTGTHETTTLCAQMIQKYAKSAQLLYDIGCGSGILAIIAKALGVPRVIGVDIDDKAVEASVENATLNQFGDTITFLKGNGIELLTEKADIIVANIIADVIIAMASQIDQLMHSDSLFIASGILCERLDDVKNALIDNGFSIVESHVKGEWAVIVSKRG